MKERLTQCANRIWRTLGKNGPMSIPELSTQLMEESEIVYQALGWLTCEDSITCVEKDNQVFVSLNDCEMEIFNHHFR